MLSHGNPCHAVAVDSGILLQYHTSVNSETKKQGPVLLSIQYPLEGYLGNTSLECLLVTVSYKSMQDEWIASYVDAHLNVSQVQVERLTQSPMGVKDAVTKRDSY